MTARATVGAGRTEPERPREVWHWQQAQIATLLAVAPREEPPNPEIGQTWYDAETNCLYVWDGAEWVCVAAD